LWNVEADKTFKAKPDSGASTLVEALTKSKERHGSRRCVGMRELVKAHMVPDDKGVPREKLEMRNEYSWLSYSEYHERVLSLARGFSLLGIEPKSKVVIYAETQRDWMVSAFAAWYSNAQVVTIYATLGEEGAKFGIDETEATTVVVDAKLLKVLAKILPQCKTVKNVITMTACEDAMAEKIKGSGIESLHSVDSLIEAGRTWNFSPKMPTPEDVAVIMYTSGTTGTPKGVVLSHGNIVATIAGVEHALKGAVTCEDVYLAYLPLAHIMEMVAEVSFMALGCALGFGNPHTLLSTGDASKKLMTQPSPQVLAQNPSLKPEVAWSIGDAPLLQPTFMVFPPAILDKIYQGVSSKMSESWIGSSILSGGLKSGERHLARGEIGPNMFYKAFFQSKVASSVGGKLRGIISGSAPLSPEVQKFVQTVFSVPVRQGYGLTETCAGSAVAFWGDNSVRSVGPPTVSATFRLADWAEGNYLNSDKDKPEIGMPRGEVLIGGPGVSLGYYISASKPNAELQKKNAEDWVTIDGVRFFRTGDIGQVSSNGTLQIIDRKKDLWKGPNGEYVALAKVEQALTLCEYVSLPMCYGRTGADFPVALICPQKRRIEALAAELGIADAGDFAVLCANEQIVQRVGEACRAVCREKKLVEFEIPKKFALIPELWTSENDMLTAAQKLKRPAIAAKHKEDLDKLYGSGW